MKIRILTDTSCGLTKEECDKLGYSLIPLPFIFDGVEYNDFVLSGNEYYEKLKNAKKVSTSQVDIAEVTNAFDEILKTYDKILYLPITSGLSSAYATGLMLEKEDKYKGKVYTIDHKTYSVPQVAMLANVKKLIEAGFSAEEIKDKIENNERTDIWVTSDTLEYMRKGGRLSNTSAIIGTLLNIKPILYTNGDKLEVLKKERNILKALDTLKCLLKDKISNIRKTNANSDVVIEVAYSGDINTYKDFIYEIKALSESYGYGFICGELASVLICHIGPKALGVGVYQNTK